MSQARAGAHQNCEWPRFWPLLRKQWSKSVPFTNVAFAKPLRLQLFSRNSSRGRPPKSKWVFYRAGAVVLEAAVAFAPPSCRALTVRVEAAFAQKRAKCVSYFETRCYKLFMGYRDLELYLCVRVFWLHHEPRVRTSCVFVQSTSVSAAGLAVGGAASRFAGDAEDFCVRRGRMMKSICARFPDPAQVHPRSPKR